MKGKPFLAIVLTALPLLLANCGGGSSNVPGGVVEPVRYARNISIERCDGYSVVRLRDPWDTLRQRACYILVDRDVQPADNLPEGTVIRVPVERAVVYGAIHAAMIEQFGAQDAICGVCEPQYISSHELRSLVASGAIADLGNSMAPDIEKMIDLEPEIILASPFENSGYGQVEKIGVPIVEAADYMENHPLGRAEWGRFYGMLFGRAETADSIFRATECRYDSLRALASGVVDRPTVVLERRYGSTWFVPAGGSYTGRIQSDAGADYIFADIEGSNSVPLPFETIYDKAGEADFWLFKYESRDNATLGSLAEEYPQYANFKAFRNRNVLGCNTRWNTYFDDITLHPDYVLEEMIRIFHPELLPEGSLRYYTRLEEN